MQSTALQARAETVLRLLHAQRPDPRVELEHRGPFQLLVATILSAQSTDARVNLVTPALFRRYPDARSMARAGLDEIETLIRSTGFFRTKARSLQRTASILSERHQGEVPQTVEELTVLPGVGRKTANVVLGAGYGIEAGIVVDTHMARLARRLKLTRNADPVRIERDLLAIVPPGERIFLSIAGVLHGRYVCQARRPRCSQCALAPVCPSNGLETRTGPGKSLSRKPRHPRRRPRPGRS